MMIYVRRNYTVCQSLIFKFILKKNGFLDLILLRAKMVLTIVKVHVTNKVESFY